MLRRVRPEDLIEGDVLYHGYGWGTFLRLVDRELDYVIHFRSRDEKAKRRSVRWERNRNVWILERNEDVHENQG